MRIEELLNYHYEKMSDNEKYVCHYLRDHYRECEKETIDEFAASCSVSKTLLVRFAKKLGLSGYSELKARIKLERQEQAGEVKGLLQVMTESYHKMMDNLNEKDLTSLFEKMYQAKRIFVYGSGSSQARAASEMKRIFLPAREIIHLHGHDMYHALKKVVSKEDLVFFISLTGESEYVVELARELRIYGIPMVSITRLTSNRLASVCDENLYINSVTLPVEYQIDYESSTPYFILIEYLYISYQNFLSGKDSAQNNEM